MSNERKPLLTDDQCAYIGLMQAKTATDGATAARNYYERLITEGKLRVADNVGVGDVVEVLNEDGEVPGNMYYCARGARGIVTSIFDVYVKLDINGREGLTRLVNVVKYRP